MKERPILFSAPMVRAILSGQKTQTRRLLQPYRPRVQFGKIPADVECLPDRTNYRSTCPYGKPGDRLWVRESFSGPWCMEAQDGCAAVPPSKWGEGSRIWYWADGNPDFGDWTKLRPSIHMPRRASRITLEVTDVRVERLQDISDADAISEGIERHYDGWYPYKSAFFEADGVTPANYFRNPVDSYRTLWESINGPGSWHANPWVWVIEFRRNMHNIAGSNQMKEPN